MDKYQQFGRRLMQLHEDITAGLAYYSAWKKLHLHDPNAVQWSLDRQNQIFGRWKGFFTPAGFALRQMAMLQFAKVFDNRRGTASLTRLLEEARRDASLLPHAGPDDLLQISDRLTGARETIATIRKLRHQRIAHTATESQEIPSLMSQKIESLAEDIKFAFNGLSIAHNKAYWSWDSMLTETADHTKSVLARLSAEIEGNQLEFDAKMVEIGLGHIRHIEGIMGAQLTEEAAREAISSLGLTREQLERVIDLNRPYNNDFRTDDF